MDYCILTSCRKIIRLFYIQFTRKVESITEEKQNNGESGEESRSARDIRPGTLYKYTVPMAAMALIDIILYALSQSSGSALTSLIATGIYFVLSVLQIGLIPVCAAAAIFSWVVRIVGKRMDRHTWITLSLTVLSLIWAIAKIAFLVREFSV